MKGYIYILIFGFLYGCVIVILLLPTKSEKLYPTKFEICRQDTQCSYTVDDIPNSFTEEYLKSKK
jgi:hypothetical protein